METEADSTFSLIGVLRGGNWSGLHILSLSNENVEFWHLTSLQDLTKHKLNSIPKGTQLDQSQMRRIWIMAESTRERPMSLGI